MSQICPAVLAADKKEFARQMVQVSEFADRVQIDLMDGEFAKPKSIEIDEVWWPTILRADLHLMYKRPMDHLKQIIDLRPHLVIIHAEADVHHMHFAAEMHKENINVGLAVLPETTVDSVEDILHSFDHFMVFSGDLGKFGGKINLDHINKSLQAKAHHENLEIGWDGGISDKNAKQLADGGVDVLNVGGFIHNSKDPRDSFNKLVHLTI